MMKILVNFLKHFKPMTEQEKMEKYLSQSVDLVDLERRQKNLTNGWNKSWLQ